MEYTITNVQRRDEWGQGMVDYAIALQGEQGWIKLTQKVTTRPPEINEKLTGIIETKQNANGNSYKKFKKVNPNFTGNPSQGQSSQGQNDRLEYAIKMLEELTGRRQVEDTVVEVTDEPITLEDPFAGLGI